jgi:uncharacterized protein (DUF1499 family)
MNSENSKSGQLRISKTLWAGILLALISFVVFFMSGFGYNWEYWNLGRSIQFFKWGAVGELAGIILMVIGIARFNFAMATTTVTMSGVAMILALLVVGTAIYFMIRARSVPPIHDITTNISNPPQFIALQKQRKQAPNEIAYPGGETAELQKKHYPQVQPLWLAMNKDEALQKALESARQMHNWEIQAVDTAGGRIEATHTIMWFGFKDDVTIRIQPDSARKEVRVDMRSASRIGRSDLGVNARRIKKFMDHLRSQTME